MARAPGSLQERITNVTRPEPMLPAIRLVYAMEVKIVAPPKIPMERVVAVARAAVEAAVTITKQRGKAAYLANAQAAA